MDVYHVVTESPIAADQVILFDENHHSGVYDRVQEKLLLVKEINANLPEKIVNRR